MNESTPSTTRGESVVELRALRERKEALQNAVRIAKAINRLQKGLSAVLLMGNTTAKIPKHAARFYSELSAETRQKPANVLQSDLVELDRRVLEDFNRILGLARGETPTIPGTPHTDIASISTQRLVEDFRRRAQTAVCLRIALQERGVSVAPFALPIPELEVRSHISSLEEKEKQQKNKIRTSILALKNDIEKMLEHPSFPDAMKQDLHRIHSGLKQDIDHIDSGRDIDELPFHVETVVEESPVASVAQTPPRSPVTSTAVAAPVPHRGFLAVFREWLNTPWGVTWKQLRRRKRSD